MAQSNDQPLRPASKWRVLAWPPSFGSGRWNVAKVSARFDRRVDVVGHIASGSVDDDLGPHRAFDGRKDTWWAGTASHDADGRDELFVGLELDGVAVPTSFVLRQAPGESRARIAVLQYYDGEAWVSARTRRLLEGGSSELLAADGAPQETGWSIAIDRSVIEPRDDYHAFVVVFLDTTGHEIDRREIREPDVLDLSRGTVRVHGVDRGLVDRHVIIPLRRGGSIETVQVKR
jgi:hypothetical protein